MIAYDVIYQKLPPNDVVEFDDHAGVRQMMNRMVIRRQHTCETRVPDDERFIRMSANVQTGRPFKWTSDWHDRLDDFLRTNLQFGTMVRDIHVHPSHVSWAGQIYRQAVSKHGWRPIRAIVPNEKVKPGFAVFKDVG